MSSPSETSPVPSNTDLLVNGEFPAGVRRDSVIRFHDLLKEHGGDPAAAVAIMIQNDDVTKEELLFFIRMVQSSVHGTEHDTEESRVLFRKMIEMFS